MPPVPPKKKDNVSLTELEPYAAPVSGETHSQWPLIGPGDPAPYTVYNADGKAPILLVCDHASNAFPAALNQLGLADWVLEKHVAMDIGAAEVTRRLADRLDAPAVLSGYSRLIIDPNRQLHDVSAFIQVSDGIAVPGNLDLDEKDKQERVDSFFLPYHEAINHQLDLFRARSVVPAFISIHTCTPVFNNVVRHCHIGVMWDEDERIPVPLISRLRENPELSIGDNEPYSGRHPHDFTIDHHAESIGLPCVGIEVRQDLVATEDGVRKWSDILADAFGSVLADTSIFSAGRTD
jgi:predicted N-formylglutamate amidohydrolase